MTTRISNKLAARKKAIQLAEKYGGKMKRIGDFGYGFETDEATMRAAADELGLEIVVDEAGVFSAFREYPNAGEEAHIFADLGGFQHINKCVIGVGYTCL